MQELHHFATELFEKAGLENRQAQSLSRIFIEADLMGFSTHGLHRVASNLAWLESGESRREGDHIVLHDSQSTFNWDADFLPGPWIMQCAINDMLGRVKDCGVVTATIRRSQHIACLAAYLPQIIEAGCLGLLTCSTPSENTVCMHGGIDPVFSANPIALGAPTDDTPLLFDMSMSVTAGGYVARANREGKLMPEACLKDNQGRITNQPDVLFTEPPGSILPIGGATHGYKGSALSILTEVLSMALGGYGRADEASKHDGESNSVFIQLINPQAFGGLEGFKRQVGVLRDLCESSNVVDGDPAVRFPGRRAWQLREQQRLNGVDLYPSILLDIQPWAEKLNVTMPKPL